VDCDIKVCYSIKAKAMVLPPSGDDRDAALLERKCYEQLRTAVRAWSSSRFSSITDPGLTSPHRQPPSSADPLPSFPLASLNTGSCSSRNGQMDYDSSSSSSPSSSSPPSSHTNTKHAALSPASATPPSSSPNSATSASSSSTSSSGCSSSTTSPSPSPSQSKLASTSSKHTAVAAAHAKSTFLPTPKHALSVPSLAKSALERGGICLYKTSMDAQQLERALATSKAASRQGKHTLLMAPDSPICLKEFGYLDLFTLDATTADELGMLEMDFYSLQPKGKVHTLQRKDAKPGTPWTLVGQFSTGITSLGQLLQGCTSVRSEGSVRHSVAQVAAPSSAPLSLPDGDGNRLPPQQPVAQLAVTAAAPEPLTHSTAASTLQAAAAAAPKAAATAAMPPGVPSSGRSQGKPSALQAHKGPCRITNSVGRHMRGNASLC